MASRGRMEGRGGGGVEEERTVPFLTAQQMETRLGITREFMVRVAAGVVSQVLYRILPANKGGHGGERRDGSAQLVFDLLMT